MALNRANGLKQHIENSGLALAAYRDVAPADETGNYVTIQEGISAVPNGAPDGGTDTDLIEQIQVDLWEPWKDPDGSLLEDPAIADELERVLHGAQLKGSPMRVYRVALVNRRRLLEPSRNLVHTAFTLNVYRIL